VNLFTVGNQLIWPNWAFARLAHIPKTARNDVQVVGNQCLRAPSRPTRHLLNTDGIQGALRARSHLGRPMDLGAADESAFEYDPIEIDCGGRYVVLNASRVKFNRTADKGRCSPERTARSGVLCPRLRPMRIKPSSTAVTTAA